MNDHSLLLERIRLLEQRVQLLEGARNIDRNATILAMREMSTTIRMIVAQLAPILGERQMIKKAMEDAAIEQVFEVVKKTQKYLM